jgi:RNA polymerase-binding transcription factor DksA
MKYIIILSILIATLTILYMRLRPYIKMIRQAIDFARQIQTPKVERSGNKKVNETKLVKCVSCGTWIPAARALASGQMSSIYCSQTCMENIRAK